MAVSHFLSSAGLAGLLALPFGAYGQSASSHLHPMSSAELCGQCHQTIVEAWKDSAHAHAMDSKLFQAALGAAEDQLGASTRSVCMGCHAPLGLQTNDLNMDRKVTWEGVTCDYCHSVRTVDLDSTNPRARAEFSLAKSGPLKDAFSSGHPTQFSPVHTSSAICAPCHEYKNAQGFAVLTTFSEWKASRYGKEGKTCQGCHMSAVAGKVADARFEREPTSSINLHKMAGSHSVAQLNRAVKMKLDVRRDKEHARATVDVTNIAAGHSVPTGSPLRQLVLEVSARMADGKEFRERRVYTRTVKDKTGKILNQEHFVFVKAGSEGTDTRLKPDETRREEFHFDLPPGVGAEVKATLSYFYSPYARPGVDQKVNFLSVSQRLR